jgi:hypothetical protein
MGDAEKAEVVDGDDELPAVEGRGDVLDMEDVQGVPPRLAGEGERNADQRVPGPEALHPEAGPAGEFPVKGVIPVDRVESERVRGSKPRELANEVPDVGAVAVTFAFRGVGVDADVHAALPASEGPPARERHLHGLHQDDDVAP